MRRPHVVLDTNVVVSALRSGRGASNRVFALVGSGKFDISVSVPLVLEYEDALLRDLRALSLTERDVRDVIDYLCAVANQQPVFFLWRPRLSDPKDDLVLELAVAAGCDAIVTFNRRDFAGVEQFGLRVVAPREFLIEIGELR